VLRFVAVCVSSQPESH